MNKLRLLCIGDDLGFHDMCQSLLRLFGYEVLMTENALRALHLLTVRCPDVAIVDYDMVRISGAGLASKIKRVAPTIPVILISGCHSVITDAPLFLDAAFNKGDSIAHLIAQIEELATSRIGTALPPLPRAARSQHILK